MAFPLLELFQAVEDLAQVGVISGVGGVNGSSTGDQPGSRSFRTGLRLEW